MVFIALLMLPWSNMMHNQGAIPWALADDIFLLVPGPNPAHTFLTSSMSPTGTSRISEPA